MAALRGDISFRYLKQFFLVVSVVDRGFEPRSGQTKDYKIGICCFSAKHKAYKKKRADWLARNIVSERNEMSIRRLLFQ